MAVLRRQAAAVYPLHLHCEGGLLRLDLGDEQMRGRDIHQFILARVIQCLGERSWAWLARTSGVPRTTLMTQVSRRKFSIEVLLKVSKALGEPVTYFLPDAQQRDSDVASARRTLRLLEKYLDDVDQSA